MKRRSKAGFTLAETLLTVLILLLVTIIMANGVPLALRVYERVVTSGNARLLLSTTISVLRDELATAREIKVNTLADGTPEITYFSMDRGAQCRIFLKPNATDTDALRQIYIQEYMDADPVTGKPYYGNLNPEGKPVYDIPEHALVSIESGDKSRLVVTYDTVTLNPAANTITIGGLAVYRASDTDKTSPVDVGRTYDDATRTISLTARIIMPVPPTPIPGTP